MALRFTILVVALSLSSFSPWILEEMISVLGLRTSDISGLSSTDVAVDELVQPFRMSERFSCCASDVCL